MGTMSDVRSPFQCFRGFEHPCPDGRVSEDSFKQLLELEEAQFNYCVELDRTSSKKTAQKSAAVREWWSVANAILWAYVRTKAQHDAYLEPMPSSTIGRLANMAEELSGGNVPSFIRDVASSGKGRPYWRLERMGIGYALLYIEAASRGDIADTRAKSTVAETYGVSAQTVRNWFSRRDELIVGIPKGHKTPTMLTRLMREHGETFARIGRSTMKGIR